MRPLLFGGLFFLVTDRRIDPDRSDRASPRARRHVFSNVRLVVLAMKPNAPNPLN